LSDRGRTRASSVSVLSRGRGESPEGKGRMQAEQKLVFAMFRNRPSL
jgi:hypothetical protein